MPHGIPMQNLIQEIKEEEARVSKKGRKQFSRLPSVIITSYFDVYINLSGRLSPQVQ